MWNIFLYKFKLNHFYEGFLRLRDFQHKPSWVNSNYLGALETQYLLPEKGLKLRKHYTPSHNDTNISLSCSITLITRFSIKINQNSFSGVVLTQERLVRIESQIAKERELLSKAQLARRRMKDAITKLDAKLHQQKTTRDYQAHLTSITESELLGTLKVIFVVTKIVVVTK